MKVLWITSLPLQIQDEVFGGVDLGARENLSWILGHLPPPPGVELHLAVPVTRGAFRRKVTKYHGAYIHLVRCPRGRLQTGYLLDPLFFQPLMRNLQPDVVHGWGTEDSHSIIAQALAPNHHVVQIQGLINLYRPFLTHLKGMGYTAFRERRCLQRALDVFVESRFSAEITRPYCGPETCIHVVDHPLRSDFLDAPIHAKRDPCIVYLGSMDSRKGCLDAIHAFSRLRNKNWRLEFIGTGSLKSDAQAQIEILGIANRVEFLGRLGVDALLKRMTSAEILLLPSRLDTGPTALKESLALGLWPVCYANSGPLEYIQRFEFGSLAKTGSIDELAQCLQEAVQTRPWEKDGVRERVIERVRIELGPKYIWKQLLARYTDIAERSPRC